MFSRSKVLSTSSPPPVYTVGEPPSDPTEIKTQRIDFDSFGLPEYSDKIALVIDNLFNKDDCRKIFSATGGSFDDLSGAWSTAQVDPGGGQQYFDTSYRNSGRIMVDDHELADWIFKKLMPHLQDIQALSCAKGCFRATANAGNATHANLVQLNGRLRFLKYQAGSFFKRHCDGFYITPDFKQTSFYTLQIYLNGTKDTIKGGATRIFSHKDAQCDDGNILRGPCADIPPRQGRVLIFEQEKVLHSGEPVFEGVKVSYCSTQSTFLN